MATTSIARSDSSDPTLCSNLVMPSSQNINVADVQRQGQDGRDVPAPSAPPAVEGEQTDNGANVPAVVADDPITSADPTSQPASKVSITLLLVSGRRRTVEFEPKVTVGELKEMVYSTWPSDWSDELPPSAAFLRILYLGRILTDETSLSSFNLPAPPESTVMHISVRSFAPNSGEEDVKKPKKRGSRRGRSSGGDSANGVASTRDDGDDDNEDSAGCCNGCVIC